MCHNTDHSKETCPRMQHDLWWCPQPNSWWNNNQIAFQFPQIAHQVHQPSLPRRQSLEDVVYSLAQETQEYMQWSRDLNQRMAEMGPNFSFPTIEEAVTSTPQPLDYFPFPTLNEEGIYFDDCYEQQLEVEHSEDHDFCYSTKFVGVSDFDESFWDEELFNNKESEIVLNENEFQVPEAIIIPHEDQDYYKKDFFEEESIIISVVEPLSTPHENPWFQDHVEMVICEHDKPSVEIFLALHIELTKRRWRWRKRKIKERLGPYISIVSKGPRLLSRAHTTSLMKIKHMMAPRPKPPDYS